MTSPRFIHLRLHSAYSLLEGAIPVKALPKLCEAADMPAVALTDTGNLFAALEFSEVMAKAGLQPIIGCQLALAYAAAAHPGDRAPAPRSGCPAGAGRGGPRQPAEALVDQLSRLRGGAAACHAWRRWPAIRKG